MTWIYSQSSGKLFSPSGVKVATGYAGGNCGKNPEGKNNHLMQSIKSIGPIVCGLYRRGVVVLKSHLGPFAIPLIPDAANDMMGRGGFFMHGDTTPSGNASEGCIIMPRAIREAYAASDDDQLQVVP